ncbi:hypothetical protein M885DRAFT_528301 [Pelagophyceae sp. CCMP2097]|nr:hypothetical protein M885DRAFT_528301 [Pelagophyceae sp. CCMP2097]
MEEEDDDYAYSEVDEDDEADGDDAVCAAGGKAPTMAESLSESEDLRRGVGSARLADGAYSVLERHDVEKMKNAKISELADMLEIPVTSAEALLRHSGWSSERLMEAFVCDAASLLRSAGIDRWQRGPSGGVALPQSQEPTLECRICLGDVSAAEGVAAPCGHFFCSECYKLYLNNAVDEGNSAVHATCPEDKCATLVPPELMAQCVDAVRAAKYTNFCLGHFVSFSKELRYCPGAGCDKVVRAGSCVAQVKCGLPGGCGASFCMRCGEEGHQPASCALVRLWLEKCQNESETANWILANTKRCPKCTTRIEKNQGCNHMNCSQCKYEFCWMCMGDWKDHGTGTGGYYKCNKFDPNGSEDDDDQVKAKRELDRYLHYYKRWQGHGSAQKFAVKQLEATEKRMVQLQESTHGSWIDVQFLKAANEMVIDCRRTLKATYVFGYYLRSDAAKQRELFENLQEHLERFTESLSEHTELPIDKMDRSEIVNITRVTESFLQNLVAGAESGLDVEEPSGRAPPLPT